MLLQKLKNLREELVWSSKSDFAFDGVGLDDRGEKEEDNHGTNLYNFRKDLNTKTEIMKKKLEYVLNMLHNETYMVFSNTTEVEYKGIRSKLDNILIAVTTLEALLKKFEAREM